MDPNDPNFFSKFGAFFNSENFSNSEDFQNSQYDPSQISPHLNQIPTSHEHSTSQNISRNLFEDVQNPRKNQKVAKNVTWCIKEDIAIMSSWIRVSEDSIREKNQKNATLWSRVHEMFEEARKDNPREIGERNIESMKGRKKRLSESANKWVAACKEANARKMSGMSQKDIEMEAHSIYEEGGSKFLDSIVFNDVMRKHPKWSLTFLNEVGDEEESGGSTKRSKTSESGEYSIPSNPETPTTAGSTISRPTGRDKAKRKGKGKATTSQFSNDEMVADIHALRLSKDNENELLKAKIELDREKLKMNSLKFEKKMLVKLLAKDHLSPEDEEMKRHLIAMIFGK